MCPIHCANVPRLNSRSPSHKSLSRSGPTCANLYNHIVILAVVLQTTTAENRGTPARCTQCMQICRGKDFAQISFIPVIKSCRYPLNCFLTKTLVKIKLVQFRALLPRYSASGKRARGKRLCDGKRTSSLTKSDIHHSGTHYQ